MDSPDRSIVNVVPFKSDLLVPNSKAHPKKLGTSLSFRKKKHIGDEPQTPAIVSNPHHFEVYGDDANKSALLKPHKGKRALRIQLKKKRKIKKNGANFNKS